MSDETYDGWANRETWAFWLWVSNDEGLYSETLEQAAGWDMAATATDYQLGDYVVTYWRDQIADWRDNFGTDLPSGLASFRDEVGSWWRVDRAEIGEAVREALENES